MRGRILAILLCVGAAPLRGAAPQIEARLDRDSIMIGDQVTLTVDVDRDAVQVVEFPSFADNKIGGVLDVVREYAPDTLARDGRKVKVSKRYVITSFEEGDYRLGGFPVLYLDKNLVDTLYSPDSLRLQVGTYPIDTALKTIYDIKPVAQAPLLVGEVRGYILWGALALAVLASVAWFVVQARRRLKTPDVSLPGEPAHVTAIRGLESLHNQKLWQSGRHKQFYTSLTDIMRRYMEGRWGIAAMEMTSDEIFGAVSALGLADKPVADLRRLLDTADLVKFAKYTPPAELNEAVWYGAYYFVEETKEAPETDVPEEEGKEAGDE